MFSLLKQTIDLYPAISIHTPLAEGIDRIILKPCHLKGLFTSFILFNPLISLGDGQNFISEMETLRNKTGHIFPVSQPGDGTAQASGVFLYISLTLHSPYSLRVLLVLTFQF